jgi:hypothetical protein
MLLSDAADALNSMVDQLCIVMCDSVAQKTMDPVNPVSLMTPTLMTSVGQAIKWLIVRNSAYQP